MKTYLTYGLVMTLTGALLSFALYFLGFYSNPSVLTAARWISGLGGFAIVISCITLGIKASRAAAPDGVGFNYGQALAAGLMITVFASSFGVVTNYLYASTIGARVTDVMMQAEIAKLEARGMGSAQIEQVRKTASVLTKPGLQTVTRFYGSSIIGTIISLVAAAFLRRAPSDSVNQAIANAAPDASTPRPEDLRGFNWGAFFWVWIWAAGNRSFNSTIVLLFALSLVPGLATIATMGLAADAPVLPIFLSGWGFIAALALMIYCGNKGYEMAWRNMRWMSVGQCRNAQRAWGYAAILPIASVVVLGALVLADRYYQ